MEIPIRRQVWPCGDEAATADGDGAGLGGPSAAGGRGRGLAPGGAELAPVPGERPGPVPCRRRRATPEPADAALGGRQDLGDQQVGTGAHLGELVPLGLGHEVDGAQLERLERDVGPFLGEGADHDHGRLVRGQQQRQGLEPRDLGHLDVERDHIGLEPDGLQDRLPAVARHAHHLDLGCRAQQVAEQPPHQRRVIDHEHADAARSGTLRALRGVRVIVRFRHPSLLSSAIRTCVDHSLRRACAELVQQVQHALALERLDDEVDGAVANRVHQRLLLVEGRHHDDLGLGIQLADLPQGLEPPHDRHHQVHRDQVGLEPLVERDSLFAVDRLAGDFPARLRRHAPDQSSA